MVTVFPMPLPRGLRELYAEITNQDIRDSIRQWSISGWLEFWLNDRYPADGPWEITSTDSGGRWMIHIRARDWTRPDSEQEAVITQLLEKVLQDERFWEPSEEGPSE